MCVRVCVCVRACVRACVCDMCVSACGIQTKIRVTTAQEIWKSIFPDKENTGELNHQHEENLELEKNNKLKFFVVVD